MPLKVSRLLSVWQGEKALIFFVVVIGPFVKSGLEFLIVLSYEHALDIGQHIVEEYNKGTFDRLYVVYNEFKSVMQQQVVVEKLLPIEALESEENLSVQTATAATGDVFV